MASGDAGASNAREMPALAYQGHGAGSVSAEVLAHYRPRSLPAEVSRAIQSLFDLRGPGMGQVTSDGKRLFFNWVVTGVSQVWRLDGPGMFPRQMTGGEDSTTLGAVSPDGKFLVIVRDRKGEENPGLYWQPSEGGELVEIQHKKDVQSRFEFVSDDSRYVYFTANDKKKDSYAVYRYDMQSKVPETVFDQDGLYSIADFESDGRLLLRRATGSLTAEFSLWDPKQSRLLPLLGQGEKEEYEVAFGQKPGELLVLTNKLSNFRRLYRYREGKLIPIGEEVPFDVSSFQIDQKRARILYALNENGYTRPRAVDAATYRPVALPKLPLSDHVFWGRTVRSAKLTTLAVDDGQHPPRAYVLDWTTNKLTPWHWPSTPELDTTRFARAELASYPARDGVQIPVLIRKPERCKSDPCPVVIHFHGGPEGQSVPGFNVQAQAFVRAGFVFVEPNVRGSDGLGKAWLHADDGPKRLEVIGDIEDAGKWAKATFASSGKPPKVGIYGGSYGGYSVLMGMTLFAGTYDAGADIVGISNLSTFLKNTAPYRRTLRISEYGDPEKDADALAKLSPMTYLGKVNAPLLILQGATDPRVPAGEAVQIHEALQKRGVSSELMIFPDEGHGAQKRENKVLMLGHSIAFFEKHLLATP